MAGPEGILELIGHSRKSKKDSIGSTVEKIIVPEMRSWYLKQRTYNQEDPSSQNNVDSLSR